MLVHICCLLPLLAVSPKCLTFTIVNCSAFQNFLNWKCFPHQCELCILNLFSHSFSSFHFIFPKTFVHPLMLSMASQIRLVSEEIMSYHTVTSDQGNTEIFTHSLNLVRCKWVFQVIDYQVIFPKHGNTRPL